MADREELLKELEEAWRGDRHIDDDEVAIDFGGLSFEKIKFARGYLSAKRRYSKPAAQQLETEYLAEHRVELEGDAETFLTSAIDQRLSQDHILSDLCFFRILLEKHLAAERARI